MALFVAKKRELRIIVKPSDRTFDEARRPVIIRGERVEFVNHRFQTQDLNLVDWLCKHPLYGSAFICAEGKPVVQKPIKETPTVQMSTGARTSANLPAMGTKEDMVEVPASPENYPSYETPITKDEIEIMIDQKLDAFLGKVVHIMQSQASAKEPGMDRPKRSFKCPHCDEVFKSGIEVGKHKKLAHFDKI